MYFPRKVHKSPHQLRPIVFCFSGPTQKISQLANNLLKDYLITSFTQVIHAIEALSIPMKKRDFLFLATLDVKALYSSIPQNIGVTFDLQQTIPTNPPTAKTNPLKNMLREMLLHVLQEKTFEFAARTIKQTKGVAMGTPVAPTLANLFMGKLEQDALQAWPSTQSIIWLCYIDDILLILEDSQDILLDLLRHLNGRMSYI